jgi:hypothetical protein
MNNKEFKNIERFYISQIWDGGSSHLSNYMGKLIAEVRRLNEANKKHIEVVTDYVIENQRLQHENDLLKATSPLMTTTPLEIEIKHYKEALEGFHREVKLTKQYLDSICGTVDKPIIPSLDALGTVYERLEKIESEAQKTLRGEGE